MGLYTKIDKYLTDLNGNIFKMDEFISSLSEDVIKEFKLIPDNDNKSFIEERLKKFLFSVLKNKKMLALYNGNSNDYILFDSDEAKIIFLFKKFGFPILDQPFQYSLLSRELNELFKIYDGIIKEEKIQKLKLRNFLKEYCEEVYLIIKPTIICNSSNDTEVLLEVIGKNLEMEYLKKIDNKHSKIITSLNKSEQTLKELNVELSNRYEELEKLKKENEGLKKKYKDSTLYSISTMGIFLAIFSLISINATSVFELIKGEKIFSKFGGVLLINGVVLMGVSSLILLIKSFFSLSEDEKKIKILEKKVLVISIILCLSGVFLIFIQELKLGNNNFILLLNI
ncbi:MAG: hypothetical protein MR995_09555 [Fusobacterium mortiferum]|jgi:hypothetical protein|uniref:Uncharacterized protein n=1 Tax=Fusobacterium mortiferum ATCC 9817 TaxID=469616 RepID=A0ABM6TVH6_FUSMR|nr:hypothetical protein [Fusobacterium mortiferum]AVQ18785.1 hypothetical protein C4N19_06640 [Fusobacterium mortiferum ATCC 9817]EEO35026.1 hypothetical protein FMAG_00588 [Fusobacterium mortiferum ATCC 9817]MCI7188370.1 hypothetical protein [Fusobacterium mortiferum]DAJ46259.1 MAG TPA: hypothetical protein [Caudoviricetes sp.]